MKTRLQTSLAVGLILILNGGAFSAFAASASDTMTPPARHLNKGGFAKAKALAPVAVPHAPVRRIPETDGLSRNDEDCNYGCIDH